MSAKQRADILLVERGLCPSREKARSLIMEGMVFSGVNRVEKAGDMLSDDCELSVKEDTIPFVSRGGLKLQKAVNAFGIELCGKVCMDIGASTGGFTDCMLKHGASHVYSVDVGYGQLDWSLRSDERVTVMERTNARSLTPEMLGSTVDFCSMDVSFISIRLIMPAMRSCMNEDAEAVVLIKPQFEAGRDKVGKNGVVRDIAVHRQVVSDCLSYALTAGFNVLGVDYSPIKGPKGNIEFLMYIRRCEMPSECDATALADSIVKAAHEALCGK